MGSRTLLCVEPDERAVAQIRGALAPFGLAVESIPNGEAAVEWARANDPLIIIVSVEPRKVGYAVCNKLKRSPDLQHIPLILTSSEETPQTFEQHKKLKSRADDYLLKPFGDDDFIGKVGGLIELRAPVLHRPGNGANPDHALLGADVSEELAVGDSDIVQEDEDGDPQRARAGLFGERGGLDAAFERETDAAFAALQSSGETAPLHPVRDSGGSMWEEEKTRATNSVLETEELPEVEVEETGGPFLNLFPSAEPTPLPAAPPPAPDEVNITPDPMPNPLAAEGRLGDRLGDLQARVQSLEIERRSLQEQLQIARRQGGDATPGQPLSKDREYLSLREIINRKEKDLLDLRDALDAKDRQILDQKDRFREQDRARRDLEEKMLDIERNLVAVEERASALSHDKEKAIEREKTLKGRLDEQQLELAQAHEENEVLEKRLGQTEGVRGDLESRIAEVEATHQAELARLRDERILAETALRAELEALQKRSADELNALSDQLLAELDRTRKEHEQVLAATRSDQTAQLERERQAQTEALQLKDKAHAAELESLRHRLEGERSEGDERRQRELAEAETRRLVDLEAAEHKLSEETRQQKEDYEAKLSALERLHLHEKAELADRHRADLEQGAGRSSRAEAELETRLGELSELQTRVETLEAERDRLAAELAERDGRIGQFRDKAGDLEAKSAEYEDQILRAYQKLRTDDKLIDRAKRALAVALQVLDERTASPAAPPGPSATPSPPAQLSAVHPAGEDPGAGG
jgi:CheY-like chemotaxis protein